MLNRLGDSFMPRPQCKNEATGTADRRILSMHTLSIVASVELRSKYHHVPLSPPQVIPADCSLLDHEARSCHFASDVNDRQRREVCVWRKGRGQPSCTFRSCSRCSVTGICRTCVAQTVNLTGPTGDLPDPAIAANKVKQ